MFNFNSNSVPQDLQTGSITQIGTIQAEKQLNQEQNNQGEGVQSGNGQQPDSAKRDTLDASISRVLLTLAEQRKEGNLNLQS